MLRFAWNGISSFSAFPLRVSITIGCFLSLVGFLYLLRVLYQAFFTTSLVPGWASVVALQCIFSGVILLALEAISDYVARTYEETKNRPLYVVINVYNVQLPPKSPEILKRAVILAEPHSFFPSDTGIGALSGFAAAELEEIPSRGPMVEMGA
jgi:polyisoprenyl-phosphate glycosyltransferase